MALKPAPQPFRRKGEGRGGWESPRTPSSPPLLLLYGQRVGLCTPLLLLPCVHVVTNDDDLGEKNGESRCYLFFGNISSYVNQPSSIKASFLRVLSQSGSRSRKIITRKKKGRSCCSLIREAGQLDDDAERRLSFSSHLPPLLPRQPVYVSVPSLSTTPHPPPLFCMQLNRTITPPSLLLFFFPQALIRNFQSPQHHPPQRRREEGNLAKKY